MDHEEVDQTPEALYTLAMHAYEGGQYHNAIHIFQVLTANEWHVQKYWFGLGACHQMLREYEDALPAYGIAATIDEKNPSIHMHLAECLFALFRYEEAWNALKSAEDYAKEKAEYYTLRDELALIREKWNNRLSILEN